MKEKGIFAGKTQFSMKEKLKCLFTEVIPILFKANKGIILFVTLLFAMRTTVLNWNFIPSASMNPNLVEGDIVLVNEAAYDYKVPFFGKSVKHKANPERGDVVVFYHNGDLYVKRVMALPGDEVKILKNVFYVNGEKLNLNESSIDIVERKKLPYSELYNFHGYTETNISGKEYNVVYASGLPKEHVGKLITNAKTFVIPEGKYFMIGDNRNMSNDSRYFGAVDRDVIEGKVIKVAFNLKNIWDLGKEYIFHIGENNKFRFNEKIFK